MTQIELLLETYKDAVFQKDVEAFVAIFDTNVRVFDMWGKWSYNGLTEWKEVTEGWFSALGKNRDLVTFSDIQIDSTDEMAVVTAFVRFTAVSEEGAALRYLENRLTLVARKIGEIWKITHQHTSGAIDPGTMKVIFKR